MYACMYDHISSEYYVHFVLLECSTYKSSLQADK